MSKRQMVINYVPGEECRVAIVEDGRLEEFHAERMDGPSNHVGNIYVGKVANVEPGIQAAFVDFGLEHNGFLHTSDVHPQYFPGEDGDKTERVGRKTPRRERPPIQDCFRRGDEVAVQVLKEGVGTKGPTVTSYLSIPGRFLVMMPQMDKVGVSRKVEDEETRRKMRDILDQLDLPEGFGFILRTAGFDRTKAELKRDLAYLMRLWKDMEKRWRSGSGKPRLLYSESDLLVRALRDMLTSEIEEIVVDNEAALNRAARFLKIVSPRTSTRLVHFTGKTPIYHALGVEPQIQMIHAREVPLPSGGRLVIDETEALVAIDVNSGKMRDARDAEATAYKTNMEACDEICRQLRLRDVGGVIVNDFIDMRHLKHRRELETRMRENLKNDRARSTIGTISEFGILEMTRQRMRASHESQHFADCPTCRGRGLVQKPDSVAVESLRELASLVDHHKVARVEMVVHPRIAGELLSTKRKALSRVERSSGKHVDVRVSDAIAVDRITFYAYDDRGADLDLAALGQQRLREEELKVYEIKADAADEWTSEDDGPQNVEVEQDHEHEHVEPVELHPIEIEPTELSDYAEPRRGSGRSGHGGHAGHGGPRAGHHNGPGQHAGQAPQGGYQNQGQGYGPGGDQGGEGGERRGRRRRRRGRRGRGGMGPGGMGQGGMGQDQYAQGPHGSPQHFGDDHAPNDADDSGYAQGQQQGDAYAHDGGDQNYAPEDGPYQDQPSGEATAGYDQGGEYPEGQYQGMNQNGAYPQQGGPNDGPPGEGGRRRRRRRRGRRGRGGQGGPGGMGGMGPGQGQAQQFDQYGQPIPPQDAGYAQGGYQQPGYDQSGYDQSGYDQPGYDQPGYAEGQYAEQAYGQAAPEQMPEGEYTDENAGMADGSDGNGSETNGYDAGVSAEGDFAGEASMDTSDQGDPGAPGGDGPRRRRRRRGGRGRGRGRGDQGEAGGPFAQGGPGEFSGTDSSAAFEGAGPGDAGEAAPVESAPAQGVPVESAGNDEAASSEGGQGRGGESRGGRRRGGRGRGGNRASNDGGAPVSSAPKSTPQGSGEPAGNKPQGKGAPDAKPAAKPVRTLYGTSRRKLAPGDIKGVKREE